RHQHLPMPVDPERPQAGDRSEPVRPILGIVDLVSVVGSEAPDEASTEIAVEIVTAQPVEGVASIDDPSGHRADTAFMAILDIGEFHSPGLARRIFVVGIAQRAFEPRPSVVDQGSIVVDDGDLLAGVLADIGDVEQALVEPDPPRIAEADRPDLVPAGAIEERVVSRYRVV